VVGSTAEPALGSTTLAGLFRFCFGFCFVDFVDSLFTFEEPTRPFARLSEPVICFGSIPTSPRANSPVICLLQRDLEALEISPVIHSVRAVSHDMLGVATVRA